MSEIRILSQFVTSEAMDLNTALKTIGAVGDVAFFTADDIKKWFQRAALTAHPDKNGESSEKFDQVLEARDFLMGILTPTWPRKQRSKRRAEDDNPGEDSRGKKSKVMVVCASAQEIQNRADSKIAAIKERMKAQIAAINSLKEQEMLLIPHPAGPEYGVQGFPKRLEDYTGFHSALSVITEHLVREPRDRFHLHKLIKVQYPKKVSVPTFEYTTEQLVWILMNGGKWMVKTGECSCNRWITTKILKRAYQEWREDADIERTDPDTGETYEHEDHDDDTAVHILVLAVSRCSYGLLSKPCLNHKEEAVGYSRGLKVPMYDSDEEATVNRHFRVYHINIIAEREDL